MSVLQRSTEAFPGVQSARKDRGGLTAGIEGDTENVLPILLVCFNELKTRKRETDNRIEKWLTMS